MERRKRPRLEPVEVADHAVLWAAAADRLRGKEAKTADVRALVRDVVAGVATLPLRVAGVLLVGAGKLVLRKLDLLFQEVTDAVAALRIGAAAPKLPSVSASAITLDLPLDLDELDVPLQLDAAFARALGAVEPDELAPVPLTPSAHIARAEALQLQGLSTSGPSLPSARAEDAFGSTESPIEQLRGGTPTSERVEELRGGSPAAAPPEELALAALVDPLADPLADPLDVLALPEPAEPLAIGDLSPAAPLVPDLESPEKLEPAKARKRVVDAGPLERRKRPRDGAGRASPGRAREKAPPIPWAGLACPPKAATPGPPGAPSPAPSPAPATSPAPRPSPGLFPASPTSPASPAGELAAERREATAKALATILEGSETAAWASLELPSRHDAACAFLDTLELAAAGRVHLAQPAPFAPIRVERGPVPL